MRAPPTQVCCDSLHWSVGVALRWSVCVCACALPRKLAPRALAMPVCVCVWMFGLRSIPVIMFPARRTRGPHSATCPLRCPPPVLSTGTSVFCVTSLSMTMNISLARFAKTPMFTVCAAVLSFDIDALGGFDVIKMLIDMNCYDPSVTKPLAGAC